MIYDWKENIPGVPITAGQINDIVVKKRIKTAVIAREKTMDYELEFLPKNSIPDNAMIKIEFDVAFSLNLLNSEK